MAGLTSDRMRRVIEEAREAFDWVIVDTPPVGILTDANLLASMVDGAVLVVKAEHTPTNSCSAPSTRSGATGFWGSSSTARSRSSTDRSRLLQLLLRHAEAAATW